MQWTDTAIILSSRRFGETSAVAHVLTYNHGVHGGIIKGAFAKSNRGIVQPGNVVNATWNARLSEQLGTLKCELQTANAALLMQNPSRLAALTSACALIEQALPERHPYPHLHRILLEFLSLLHTSDHWQEAYVHLEIEILAEAGFGLDTTECAATGRTDDLIYVSPKSGRAVCREAGEPYHNKMLPLPAFLLPHYKKNRVQPAEILAGLQLTGYFLENWLLTPHNRKLPAARARLAQWLERSEMKEPHGTEETAT